MTPESGSERSVSELRFAESPIGTSSNPGRDEAIEGLRGLAAFVVLYAHVGAALGQEWSRVVPWLWPAEPTAAVLIFFVLSGYVIGLTTTGQADAARVGSFAWRRLVRLWPINFVGVLLGCAVSDALDVGTAAANLFGLQNFTDYFGLHVPVLATNTNLWSLNYEVVYYAFFAAMWWWRAEVRWTAAGAAVVGVLAWYGPPSGVFVACYAFGLLFWLGGLTIARHGVPLATERTNWPTWLLLALATWKLEPLRETVLSLPWPKPYFAGPVVRLYHLDFLPISLVLVALVSRRTFRGLQALKIASVTIPLIAWAARVIRGGGVFERETIALGVICLAAMAAWRWAPSLKFFRVFAPLGLISYALYATSRPIQEFIFQRREMFAPGAAGAVAAAALVVVVSCGIAWYLERRVQPALNRFLHRPSRLERGPATAGRTVVTRPA